MIDFNFISPTKIYFGKNKELLVGEILKEKGAKRVLLVLGKSSVFKSGLFDRVAKSLCENDIE